MLSIYTNMITGKKFYWIGLIVGILLLSSFIETTISKSKQEKIPNQFIVVFDEGQFLPFSKTKDFSSLKDKRERVKQYDRYNAKMKKDIQAELVKLKLGEFQINSVFSGLLVGAVLEMPKNKLKWIKKKFKKIIIISDFIVQLDNPTIEFEELDEPPSQLAGWGIDAVNAGNTYGGGKYAFVLDTGVDIDHPDLAVDQNLSRSFVDTEPDLEDQNGHGTMVAGIIGAKQNMIGTKGVAAGAIIVSVKMISGTNHMEYGWVVGGLDYAFIASDPGDAINMSWGIDPVPLVETLFNNYIIGMGQAGKYVSIAAGNDAEDCVGTYPARVVGPNVYTVSAMNEARELADFSNYDLPVRYSAPGVAVPVLRKNSDFIGLADGTSMAAPFVTGILLVNDGLLNYDGFLVFDRDSYPDRCAAVQ